MSITATNLYEELFEDSYKAEEAFETEEDPIKVIANALYAGFGNIKKDPLVVGFSHFIIDKREKGVIEDVLVGGGYLVKKLKVRGNGPNHVISYQVVTVDDMKGWHFFLENEAVEKGIVDEKGELTPYKIKESETQDDQ